MDHSISAGCCLTEDKVLMSQTAKDLDLSIKCAID